MKKVRTAIIGTGVMGKKYAGMICLGEVKGLVLTAVVCRSEAARQWALTLGDGIKIYRSAEELFENNGEYDAVIIAAPHKCHPEFAKRSFALGKSVMCDKPAGISVSDALEMNMAAERSGKIYAMMFHQRLYPKYLKIKELLERGELGVLKRIMAVNSGYLRTAYYHKSGGWRSSWNGEGGGALINQGQHILDIWQWLFGMPEKLYADIPFGKYNAFAVDDEATISMRYKNNLTAVFMLSTGEAVHQERLEIVGTKGRLLLEDDTLNIWRFSMDCGEYIKTAQVNSREALSSDRETIVFDKADEPYVRMLDNFACGVIENNEEILAAKGKSGINAIMLTNAAYLSAWKGEAVTLPIVPEEYDKMLSERCIEEEKKNNPY